MLNDLTEFLMQRIISHLEEISLDKEFLHILLGVSASGPTKRWDIKNFINLAKKISQIKKTKFYIAGGKNDENIISEDNYINNETRIQENFSFEKNIIPSD